MKPIQIDLQRSQAEARPPTQNKFTLEWAEPDLVDDIIALMSAAERQTMNVRTGADPKMLVCRSEGEPIGWAGLDVATWPDYPELFSLYLYPPFRRYTIGLLLETARWKYLDSLGIEVAYGRMELATNFRLFRYRLSTGLFQARDREEFPKEWVERCQTCELFGKQCTQQRFIAIDVKRALASGEARIGEFDVQDLPRPFVLRAEDVAAQSPTAPEDDRKQRYRPYWL